MNGIGVFFLVLGLAGIGLGPMAARADEEGQQLSPERLDMLDRRGYFTPGFKAAVHDLVNAKESVEQTRAEARKLAGELPDLQKQAADAEAKVVVLRVELAKYDHPEENDFVALQTCVNDPSSKLSDQIALAQAYVWTYAISPHQPEALQYLQQADKKLADQQQAEKEAEAARVAARTKLIQRAQARQLSLSEWRDFLRGMSQGELLRYLGRPDLQTDSFWVYAGDWTTDPVSNEKVGMEINWNAGRVLSVAEIHH